jgi:hypothetical protein
MAAGCNRFSNLGTSLPQLIPIICVERFIRHKKSPCIGHYINQLLFWINMTTNRIPQQLLENISYIKFKGDLLGDMGTNIRAATERHANEHIWHEHKGFFS